MDNMRSIADYRVRDLFAAIASAQVAPGAGSAAGVALGLAASCLGKAAIISLKHRPDDPTLQSAPAMCAAVARFALMDADRDSAEFAQFMHSHSAAAAARLIDTGEAFAALRTRLVALIDQIEPHVEANMAGDVVAARALAEAARVIYSRNEEEAKGG
jgi:formiminotetrahydrofolate cyclodeaminase